MGNGAVLTVPTSRAVAGPIYDGTGISGISFIHLISHRLQVDGKGTGFQGDGLRRFNVSLAHPVQGSSLHISERSCDLVVIAGQEKLHGVTMPKEENPIGEPGSALPQS